MTTVQWFLKLDTDQLKVKESKCFKVCQQHPPIALAQVKPGNTYGNSLNEILYKLYILDFEKKKLLKNCIRIITM